MTVLLANHVSVLCIELCVSGDSHTQYIYIIDRGTQSYGAPGSYKYFSLKSAMKAAQNALEFFLQVEGGARQRLMLVEAFLKN